MVSIDIIRGTAWQVQIRGHESICFIAPSNAPTPLGMIAGVAGVRDTWGACAYGGCMARAWVATGGTTGAGAD